MDCGTILVVDHDDASRSAAVRLPSAWATRSAPPRTQISFSSGSTAIVRRLRSSRSSYRDRRAASSCLRELHERFGEDLPVILVSADRTTRSIGSRGSCSAPTTTSRSPSIPGSFSRVFAAHCDGLRPFTNGNGNGNGNDGPSTFNLSTREREILALLAEGKTQAQIATALVVSPKTVATHIQHLLSKLGVHSRAQAVALAFRAGLVDPTSQAHSLEPEVVPAA